MIPLASLKAVVQRALRQVARIKDVQEAEVYASSTGHLLCRLNYTSGIPCHGVEEPKSSEAHGIGLRALFAGPDGPRVGFGFEERNLSPDGIRRALEKARYNAVADPDFVSFPEAPKRDKPARGLPSFSDRAIMDLKDSALVEAGWKVVEEALKTFESSDVLQRLAVSKEKLSGLGLIVGGDVSLFRQRIALASTRMPKVQTDESTAITAAVTAMVERKQAKGTGYSAATHLARFKGEAGAEAARNAILAINGQRLPSGSYTVILGPQPVSDLMTNLILPSLSADSFYSSRSAFLGEVGRTVAADQLTIYDDGAARNGVASKRLTCEGLPTGRTDLIRNGVLQGLLSNHYETQRLLRDPHGREKLGLNPQDHPDMLAPRNGFRIATRGIRQFDAIPSVAATNVFIEGAAPYTTESLLSLVGDGVYIGRIWYTYPVNGLRAGDFTCTVVGDSFLIRNGELAAPLRSNAVRITGNIRALLRNVVGVTKQARPVIGWASEEVVYAPEIAVRDLSLTEIAQYMESV
ncbi:MAG: TldD/PmbA family protein [Nitrospirota bacterium]